MHADVARLKPAAGGRSGSRSTTSGGVGGETQDEKDEEELTDWAGLGWAGPGWLMVLFEIIIIYLFIISAWLGSAQFGSFFSRSL